MRTYIIYKVTNNLNGMVYIGKTDCFEKRKREHTQYDINDNCIFHRALKKYGEENFTWEVIDKAVGLEAINNLERHYIKLYDSYKPNGYNMTKGGDGGSMWNARPVVCLTKSGKFVSRYDSAMESEVDGYSNSSVLQCCKSQYRQHKNKIFMFEDEYNKYGPRKYIKPKSTSRKRVVQCDLSGNKIAVFDSLKEASEKTGTCRTTMSGNLTKHYKSANGFIFVYENEYPIKDMSQYKTRKKGRRIAQVDKETGKILKVFDRITEAGEYLGTNYKSIQKVLDLPNRTAYGYKWISQ